MTTQTQTQFRIYVACLASYNNGILHGQWIDLDGKDHYQVQEEIDAMLFASPEEDAEEWSIHDYEGFKHLDEYQNIEILMDNINASDDSYYDNDLIFEMMELNDLNASEAISYLDENYAGHADNLADWAEDFLDESGQLHDVPKHLRYYIDFEAYAKDMDRSGDIFTVDIGLGIHVIWNR